MDAAERQQSTDISDPAADIDPVIIVDEYDSSLVFKLAESIRAISEMINKGAECNDIAAAAVQCAVSFLPGANAMVLRINKSQQSASVIAAANSPFATQGQQLTLAASDFLSEVTAEPRRVHHCLCDGDNPIFPERADFAAEPNNILACKAVPRVGTQCFALAILTDSESLWRASNVLMTLSELLIALCTAHNASIIQDQNLQDIARAKREWERTVDALPEVICLVDHDGYVVRSNRTIERWGLGDVSKVAGTHVHELLHDGCRSSACPLKRAVSLCTAEQSPMRRTDATISDTILGKTIQIHTRLITPLSAVENRAQPIAVIVLSDISELQVAQDNLAGVNRTLEMRVEARTAELSSEVKRRSSVEAELQASRDELAMLTEQLIDAQEEERRRVSRELHDSVGQSLGAIKYSLEAIRARRPTADPESIDAEMSAIVDRVQTAIQETRALAIGLRPPALDDIGTTAALETLCKDFAQMYERIAFHVELEALNSEIPGNLATPVYRIVQEALNNVVKHSSAETVLVSLRIEDQTLRLEVLDDGVGFDSAAAGTTGSFRRLGKVGRLGMRERALNSNGELTIESWLGEGTRILAEWVLTGR